MPGVCQDQSSTLGMVYWNLVWKNLYLCSHGNKAIAAYVSWLTGCVTSIKIFKDGNVNSCSTSCKPRSQEARKKELKWCCSEELVELFGKPKDSLGAEVTGAAREEMKLKEQETEKRDNYENLEGKDWGRAWVCLRSSSRRQSQWGSRSRFSQSKRMLEMGM